MRKKQLKLVTLNDTFVVPEADQLFKVEVWANKQPDITLYYSSRPRLCREFSAVASYADAKFNPDSPFHGGSGIRLPYYLADVPYAMKMYRSEGVAYKQFKAAHRIGLRAQFTPMYVIPDDQLTERTS